eukprot:14508955-Alexandrium_andersonii.AAC.1
MLRSASHPAAPGRQWLAEGRPDQPAWLASPAVRSRSARFPVQRAGAIRQSTIQPRATSLASALSK